MGKYSPNRKRIKIVSIDKISKMASEGGRRWKRGKRGLWMHIRSQVDISWDWSKRAAALVKNTLKGKQTVADS